MTTDICVPKERPLTCLIWTSVSDSGWVGGGTLFPCFFHMFFELEQRVEHPWNLEYSSTRVLSTRVPTIVLLGSTRILLLILIWYYRIIYQLWTYLLLIYTCADHVWPSAAGKQHYG